MNPQAGRVAPPPVWDPRSRHRLGRRVVALSFAISAAVNVLAVLIYAFMWASFRPAGEAAFPVGMVGAGGVGGGGGGGGMQVVRIVELTPPPKPSAERKHVTVPPTPKRPAQAAPETQPGHAAKPGSGGAGKGGAGAGPGAGVGEGQGGLPSAAERLRPHPESKRLWAPASPALTRLTKEERMQLALSGRLKEWQDSVQRADSISASATDWTFTDKEGRRWGVTPGELHLGKITIPLPFSFGVTPGNRSAAELRTWEWNAIQQLNTQEGIRQDWKERAKAIRERMDKQRAAAKADSSKTKH